MLTKGTKCSTQYIYMELNKYDCSFVSVPYIISPLIFFISIKRLLCTVIKIHVVKEVKKAVPYFVQDF